MTVEAFLESFSTLPDFRKALSQRLLAMLTGVYARVLDNTRTSVRDKLKTLDKRTKRTISVDERYQNSEAMAPSEHPILTEWALREAESRERDRTLVESCMDHPGLSDEDKQVLRLSQEGLTQKQIGESLGKAQSEISKQLKEIRSILQKSIEAGPQEQQ